MLLLFIPIGIMVDIKGCHDKDVRSYADQIMHSLQKYNLLSEALILINKTPINNQDKIIPYFMGKAKVSWRKNLVQTQEAASKDLDFSNKYYIFNHGADFNQQNIKGFQTLGLKVIVSINTGHYRKKPLKNGKKHLKKMLKYGADGLQIDAVYDSRLFSNYPLKLTKFPFILCP